MNNIAFSDLEPNYQYLLQEADEAIDMAYAPYSGFSVGAALLSEDGQVITGSNVENASFGGTVCAERSALLRANALAMRKFKAIAVIAKGKDFDTTEVTAPCGICRQLLFEFSQISGIDLDIIMSNSKMDKIVVAKLSQLLPMAFGPKDLGIDVSKY
jgi:cytidine deaminase